MADSSIPGPLPIPTISPDGKDGPRKDLETRCYCGAVHMVFSLPAEVLPLESHLCHCSRCRYYKGSLAAFNTILPLGIKPEFIAPSSRDNLSTHDFTPSNARGVAVFCNTCGCHVGIHSVPSLPIPETWAVVMSTIVAPKEDGTKFSDFFKIVRHIFPASAKDGGLAGILKSVGDRELALVEPEDGTPLAEPVECELVVGPDGHERLLVECHCRGVSFTIPRPDQAGAADDKAKCVSPNSNKWLAHFDVGTESRLMTGAHVQSWMQLPLSAITPAVGPELALGTLKRFVTAEGNAWAFCRGCGAPVFRLRKEDGQGVVGVAVAVLRAPEGPLAEDWLQWQPTVEFEDEGNRFDPEFVKGLLEGLKGHRICA